MGKRIVIGIDFGVNSARVAIIKDGKTVVIANIDDDLTKIKEKAESSLGERITEAVIAVPAYFNDVQRQSVKDAASVAGLDVLREMNKPVAAAFAYEFDNLGDKKVIVYDLGAGTFEVSVLEINGGAIEVLAINGMRTSGGNDFDQVIVQWMIDEFKQAQGIDLSNDNMASLRLTEAAEKAKIELSKEASTEINLPYIASNDSGPKHLVLTLTRGELESLCSNLIERTVEPCLNAMKDAGITKDQIGKVILVGGMTYMPAIQSKVKSIFDCEPSKSVNPDEAVAIGAAIQGELIADNKEQCG